MVSIRLMSAPRVIVAPSFTSFLRSLAFVTTEPVDMHAVAPVIEVVPTLVPATESSPAPHAVHDAASTVDVNVPGTQLGQKYVFAVYRPGEHCGHATVDAHDCAASQDNCPQQLYLPEGQLEHAPLRSDGKADWQPTHSTNSPCPALNMLPEQKLMTLMPPASRCTSLLRGAPLASLPESLSPINVQVDVSFCKYNAPPETNAVFRENMQDFDVRVELSSAMEPPDRALFPINVHFVNVAVDDAMLTAPPFPPAELFDNMHALICNVDEPSM